MKQLIIFSVIRLTSALYAKRNEKIRKMERMPQPIWSKALEFTP